MSFNTFLSSHLGPGLAPVLAVLVLLAACGADTDASTDADTATPAPSPTATARAEPEPEPTEQSDPEPGEPLADSFTLDDHLDWVLDILGNGVASTAEVEERLDPAFLAQVPAEAFAATTDDLAASGSGDWTVVETDPANPADGSAGAFVIERASGERFGVEIVLSPEPPHRIAGLLLMPTTGGGQAGSFDELDVALTEFAAESAIGVYEVTSGECDAVHELRGDEPMALGSVFKLWVVAGLASEVDAGRAAWDEPLAVEALLRSSPDGEVYSLDDGEELTLQRHAELMISISDNTATDHLMERVGRDAVLAAMEASGVADVAANTPLLNTRELFWLKFVPGAPTTDDWDAADDAGRQAILDELGQRLLPWVDDPSIIEALAAEIGESTPRRLDIEWFATPADLCRTMVHLDELAETPGLEAVADILSMNPGVPFDPAVWADVRFKGGSEPGVVAGAWWLQHVDGRQFVITGAINDPDTAFSDIAGATLLASAADLID